MKMIGRLINVFKEHRHLLFTLASKNLKVQYKHAFLGFLWALVVPCAMMLVFWFIFGIWFNGIRGEGIGPLFLITALFPWSFIQMSVTSATPSIVDSRDLIRKVYFPKEIIPLSVIISNFFNFAASMILLVAIVVAKRLWAGETSMITASYLFLPALMFFTMIFAAGVSLLTACGQVYFRDVRYLVEIGLLIWFYFSPVFYPISVVQNYSHVAFRVYMLNPVTSLIVLYRAVLQIGTPYSQYLSPASVIIPAAAGILTIFAVGYAVFIRQERDFVDLV